MPATSSLAAGRINMSLAPAALRVHGRSLLLPIRIPTLIDQVRVDIVDVLLAQNIVEPLHSHGSEHSLHHDVPEGRVQTVIESAQERRASRPKHMAARALFGELELAGGDLRPSGGLHQ